MIGPKGESDARPKRFYKSADVAVSGDVFGVALDGRALRTPEKAPLHLPTRHLAQAIADEWGGQGDRIDLASMTLTRLANVAIDRTPACRSDMAEEVLGYSASDCLCLRVETPAGLAAEQAARFDPWLDWARRDMGVELAVSFGLFPPSPSAATADAVRREIARFDDFALTGLAMAAPLLGSCILALAAARRILAVSEAFEIARTEEAWQNRIWGEDDEARRRTDRLRSEASALDVWFAALTERGA